MTPRTIIQAIASAVQARQNCATAQPPNTEWYDRWSAQLDQLAKDCLPSGSGIDSGTTIDLDRSRADRIVLQTAFHHMSEHGYYDGWTEHTIIVRPAFSGIELDIKGRNRNEIKEYLYETYEYALTREAPEYAQPVRHTHAETDRTVYP